GRFSQRGTRGSDVIAITPSRRHGSEGRAPSAKRSAGRPSLRRSQDAEPESKILRPSTDALCNACSRIGPTLFCGDFRLTPCQPRVRLLCAEVIPTVNPVLTGGVARYFLRLFRRK